MGTVKKYAEGFTNFNHHTTKCCFDVINCNNQIIQGILTECGNQWNYNLLCPGDQIYSLPLPLDGTIMVQLNLNDPGCQNPVENDWLTVSLCDIDGNIITTDVSEFISRWVHGWCKPINYQTYEIDASLISNLGLDCFSLQFDAEQLDTPICTQVFHINPICDGLVSFESIRSNRDCWNNCYDKTDTSFVGTGDFEYSNKIYVYGKTKCVALSSSDLEDDNTETQEVVRLFGRPLPKFLMSYLVNKILSNSSAVIVGEEGVFEAESASYSVIEGTNMYRASSIELFRECTNLGTC